MATPAAPTIRRGGDLPRASQPLLEQGDRLSRAEFEQRYERMPHIKKAELIEGIVYMPSPARYKAHSALKSASPPGWEFIPRKLLA